MYKRKLQIVKQFISHADIGPLPAVAYKQEANTGAGGPF